MPDLTTQLVTGRWTYVVADGFGQLVDADTDPDEAKPTGKVLFTPNIGGNPSLVVGSPSRSVALAVVPGLIADGILTDLNGSTGVRLVTKVGTQPVYWTATPYLAYAGSKIAAREIQFGPTANAATEIHLNDLQDLTTPYPAPVIGAAQAARDAAIAAAADADADRIAAQQAAVDAQAAMTGKADLDGAGKLRLDQLPEKAVIRYLGAPASQAAMLALVGQEGDWCLRADTGVHWVIVGSNPSQIGSWKDIPLPASAMTKAVADASYAPQSGAGSPAAALTSANTYTDAEAAARATGDTQTLTTATGRAVAFSIALGG